MTEESITFRVWQICLSTYSKPQLNLSRMSTTQFMSRHEKENAMWITKPKLRARFLQYKNHVSNYIERSGHLEPILKPESTISKVILNEVKKGWFFLQVPYPQ